MTQMRFKPLIAAAIAVTGLAIGTTTSIAQAQPQGASTPPVGMLHVQRNVHMLVVNGMNIAVQVGDDGVLLVDAATAAVAPQVIAAIRTLSPKPIHTIINTHVHPDHTGGNESLVKQRGTGAPQAVRVIAHQTVQDRMIAAAPAGVERRLSPERGHHAADQQHLRHADERLLPQWRAGRDLPRSRRTHRRRQPGALPQL